jgi:hypothetical protein
MNRFSFIVAVVFGLVSLARVVAATPNDQPKTIPLKEMWAFKMPGTKDVRELEPRVDGKKLSEQELEQYFRTSSVHQILHVLSNRPREQKDELAGPAFAVVGTGNEALKNAAAAFATKDSKWPDEWLPTDTDISLVFYSYSTGYFVRIVSVEKSERAITINYQRVQQTAMIMNTCLALIPVGKLPAGTVNVKIVELPPVDEQDRRVTVTGDPHKHVCNDFAFGVRK